MGSMARKKSQEATRLKLMSVRLSENLIEEAKIYAIRNRLSLQALITQALTAQIRGRKGGKEEK